MMVKLKKNTGMFCILVGFFFCILMIITVVGMGVGAAGDFDAAAALFCILFGFALMGESQNPEISEKREVIIPSKN